MLNKINQIINQSIQTKQSLLEDSATIDLIQSMVELISSRFKNGQALYFCGNGGSAADAQHLAAEFSGRFYKDRAPLPSEALHCNTSYLTAVGNDYGYDFIYSRLIEGLGKKDDLLIGLSTSGNSTNIIEAFKKAQALGITTIGFTGSSGGQLKEFSDYLIKVPSNDTPRIQESHIMIGHIICELVEEHLF